MNKIKSPTPIVLINLEDQLTKEWQSFLSGESFPDKDIDIKYFDLSLENRDLTQNKIIQEALESILRHRTYGIIYTSSSQQLDRDTICDFFKPDTEDNHGDYTILRNKKYQASLYIQNSNQALSPQLFLELILQETQ